jgi:hypothetical protein
MTGQPTTLRLRLIIPLGSLGRLTLFGSSRKCALGASHCRSPSGSNSSLSPNSGGCTPGWRVPPLRGDDASSPSGTNMPARPEWLGMVAFREHRSLKGSHNRLACTRLAALERRMYIPREGHCEIHTSVMNPKLTPMRSLATIGRSSASPAAGESHRRGSIGF